MKVLLTEWFREWSGNEPQTLSPVVFDLMQESHLLALYKSVADGIFDDVCFETDSNEALGVLRGILSGGGSAVKSSSSAVAAKSQIYRPGYELHIQAEYAHFFVNPIPRPELFAHGNLKAYMEEFKQ